MPAMKQNLVWLASYIKSGNTWMRFLLVNYLLDRDEPLPISEIGRYTYGDMAARAFQRVAGRPLAELSLREIHDLRPAVQRLYAEAPDDIVLVKTHSLAGTIYGTATVQPALTRCSLYIVRNPLDVAVSRTHHLGQGNEESVEAMGDPSNMFMGDNKATVFQPAGTWSQHVLSWIDAKPLKTLLLRYEDLLENAGRELTRALEHMAVPVDPGRVSKAVAFSSFDELSRQEKESGFQEASPKSPAFFRRGSSGEGESSLTQESLERLYRDHKAVIERLGYAKSFHDLGLR